MTPDGSFVDFVRSERLSPPRLWRVPFLGGTPKRIADDVWSGVGWSPDGKHMAFVRESESLTSDTLVIADADGTNERSLLSWKRPRALLSLGQVSEPNVRPSWSPDGRTIALLGVDGGGGTWNVEAIFVDVVAGAEHVVSIGRGLLNVDGMSWLDDHSLIVARSASPGTRAQLWRLSYPDGRQSRLTNDLNAYAGVHTSGDRGIVVTGRTEGSLGIWVGDGSARNGADIVPQASLLDLPAVSWAGDRILYTTNTGANTAITRVNTGGGPAEDIISDATNPSATSDGAVLVFDSNDAARTGIWKADADGRQAVQLVKGDAYFPIVTPDDKHVLFYSDRSGLQTPWMIPIDGGPAVEIVKVFAALPTLDISPDGKRLVFGTTSAETNKQYLTVVCDLPNCVSRRPISASGLAVGRPRWTRDGRGIAYIDTSTGGANLMVQPLDGGTPYQLTHFADGRVIKDFAWSHDGKRLAIARGTTTNDIVLFKGLKK